MTLMEQQGVDETTAAQRPDVSIVVPILDERGTIRELTERAIAEVAATGRTVEVLLIDDGSTDGSWQVIDELAAGDARIHGLRQRRTFGKAAALALGFDRSAGAVVVTMDGDLQDDPSELPRMLAALEGPCDAVSGWKQERHDPLSKRIPSKLFNLVLRNVSGLALHDFNCGFKAYRREAIDVLRPYVYGEMHRYLPALLGAQGYRVDEIAVKHHERTYGSSKYGLSRMAKGAFDLMTVVMLTRFRDRPLHAFGSAAALALVLDVLLAAVLGALGLPLHALMAFGVGLVLVISLLGVGIVGELAVHQMGPADGAPRIAAVTAPVAAAGRRRPPSARPGPAARPGRRSRGVAHAGAADAERSST